LFQNEYEIVFIIRPDADDAATLEVIEKVEAIITENGGHPLTRDDWGKRKLAYPIKKHLKGHYVLVNFLAPAELIIELERRIRITDAIVRFLTVKRFDLVEIEPRLEQAAEQRRLREEEARARAAAEEAASARREEKAKNDKDERDHDTPASA
jgi:small subunit ribosomal protein S6